jgi:hypothetical protein
MNNNGAGSHNNGSATSTKEKEHGKTDVSNVSAKTCPIEGACSSVVWFLKDYFGRHAHPVNASLHILGVPAAFAGFFYLFSGKDVTKGAALIFAGYLLQYLGHRAQGNEVGEVTLMKKVYRKLKGRA